jgi:hypothetical protein
MLLAAPAAADVQHLDAGVRHAILTERFAVVRRVASIPHAVMAEASAARGPEYATPPIEFAEPGAPFQSTDVIMTPRLPGRRLIVAWSSPDWYVLHYEVGGVAHTYHVAAFSLRNGHARFVWHAQLRGALANLDALRRLIRSGDTSLDDSYRRLY